MIANVQIGWFSKSSLFTRGVVASSGKSVTLSIADWTSCLALSESTDDVNSMMILVTEFCDVEVI